VENYVKLFTDHCRSMLKGAIQKIRIEDFYANSTDIIRDVLLGKSVEGKRLGLFFDKNNMRVSDVDVLRVAIADERIRVLLDQAQHAVVSANIELANAKRALEILQAKEQIAKAEAEAKADTIKRKNELVVETANSELQVILSKIANDIKAAEERKQAAIKEQDIKNVHFDAEQSRMVTEQENVLKLQEQGQEQRIAFLVAEADQVVKRLSAAQAGFSEALLVLSNNETMATVAKAMNMANAIGGNSLADAFQKAFNGTGLDGVMKKVAQGTGLIQNGNGAAKVSEQPKA
jgi:N-acetyl-beta-hexosaminidase